MQADARSTHAALDYARKNLGRFVEELCELLRSPSVSGRPEHRADVQRAADWLVGALRSAGMRDARTLRTAGAPLVVAAEPSERPSPSLLMYGHYDVVPPGDRSRWKSDPFAPVIHRGVIYARGASDDKGQLFAHLKALECWMATRGAPPLAVRCLFEGEEEIGSPSLLAALRRPAAFARADAAVVSDTRMRASGVPAITYGLRGKLRLELTVARRGGDLHSGDFAGVAPDVAATLAHIIATLTDGSGRLTVPGTEAGIRAVSGSERAYLRRTGPRDVELLAAAGIADGTDSDASRDDSPSLYERTTLEPSLAITELVAGDVGHAKSALPPAARAALDIRLVPDQDPHEIATRIAHHARRQLRAGETLGVRVMSAAQPFVSSTSHFIVRAARRAANDTFGTAPVFVRSGGTIPVASALDSLGVTPVLLGFALSSDGMHAPNEHFAIARFAKAIECSIRLLAEASRAAPPHAARKLDRRTVAAEILT